MDVREQIRAYLDDQETLYKEWYIEQTRYETGVGFGEPVGTFEDWKKAFGNWVETHKSELREVICPNADKIKVVTTRVDIILTIMDLIEEQPYVGTVMRTATLLLLYGVEKLCKGYGV
jgi:hypothetical protein